jgi:erythromycin esterase-like protein/predicted phosphoribosyltransferase
MQTLHHIRFRDRQDAGRHLASLLWHLAEDETCVILALPRGGVPVAAEIARMLGRPFDVLVVRKLGIPGHEETAMGALASGGVRILDEPLIRRLGISAPAVDAVLRREEAELERREHLYRGGSAPLDVAGRTVIVVDDGAATGASMSAAVRLLRELHAARIVVALPVAPPETVSRLQGEAEEVAVVAQPEPFRSVGGWYDDFRQIEDGEVQSLLSGKTAEGPGAAASVVNAALEPARLLRRHARPLTGTREDYNELIEAVGDSQIVLMGEATHGTHEFYRQRALITRRLIEEKGFLAVAAEADWPDAFRVNRYVRGASDDGESVEALAGFDRFPGWMWRNADVLEFVGWLRDHNDSVGSPDHQVGFYGLDLYSMHKSIDEVLAYLGKKDPTQAARAKALYSCIDRHGRDPQHYGLLAAAGVEADCREEVVTVLTDLMDRESEYMRGNGTAAADEFFFAEQNARLVRNAEEYYRGMFRSEVSSWNLRDRHMMETLVALLAHLQSRCGRAKVVVWAHNSHVGDARATSMAWRGEHNIGQLVREAFPGKCSVIGFSTYTGTVTAAAGWHLPAARRKVSPGLPGSYEHLFHQVGIPGFWLDLRGKDAAAEMLAERRLQRAIGVVYRPETERTSHYLEACLPQQFDFILHFDDTRAVEPLERREQWSRDEAPETFPAGL